MQLNAQAFSLTNYQKDIKIANTFQRLPHIRQQYSWQRYGTKVLSLSPRPMYRDLRRTFTSWAPYCKSWLRKGVCQ